jgi:hypothetical protein
MTRVKKMNFFELNNLTRSFIGFPHRIIMSERNCLPHQKHAPRVSCPVSNPGLCCKKTSRMHLCPPIRTTGLPVIQPFVWIVDEILTFE